MSEEGFCRGRLDCLLLMSKFAAEVLLSTPRKWAMWAAAERGAEAKRGGDAVQGPGGPAASPSSLLEAAYTGATVIIRCVKKHVRSPPNEALEPKGNGCLALDLLFLSLGTGKIDAAWHMKKGQSWAVDNDIRGQRTQLG